MDTLNFILIKNGLLKLIEKLLVQSGAYKTPETKEEAIAPPQLKESTIEAIEILTNANACLNAYHELNIEYSKELTRIKQDQLKLISENSKLKIKIAKLEQHNQELIKHIEL